MPFGKQKQAKQKRRARGTGTIFYSKKHRRWIGRKPVGRTPDGKTDYVEVWGETQGDVVKRLATAGPVSQSVTVEAWADRWVAGLQVRRSTLHLYKKSVRLWIKPLLGSFQVRQVTPSRIEEFAVRMKVSLGVNTIRQVLNHAGNMFRAAMREGLITANPVALARKPKSTSGGINPFTPDELARIITAAGDAPCTYPVAILAAIGCRMGESLALDVSDYDTKTGRISITRTYDREHGMGPTKSSRGIRTIRCPVDVRPVIVAAIGKRTSGPLFVSGGGRRRVAQLVGQAWARLLLRMGIEYRNPHQLRHSVATALISAGDPIGDVAVFLGDTTETIVKTYLHPAGTDPSLTLDRLLGGRKVGEKNGTSGKPAHSRGKIG